VLALSIFIFHFLKILGDLPPIRMLTALALLRGKDIRARVFKKFEIFQMDASLASERVLRLKERGLSIREIAAETAVSPMPVQRILVRETACGSRGVLSDNAT
jgi:hypothetical protein